MSYTRKSKGDKIVIQGSYIPSGFTCLCKSCNFTIELPNTATDSEIENLVNMIRR